MNEKTREGMTSSKDGTWQTPQLFLDRVRRVGPIGLDPCTIESNPTDAHWFWTLEDDGLRMPWETHGGPLKHLIFVNPPYGRGIGGWVDKCREAALDGETVIALLPARVDTRWFPWDADALCFWHGRLRFIDSQTGREGDPAMFPSVVAFWGNDERRAAFREAFKDAGKVVFP